ncbi:MAG: sigma-70 family RNA polymerase sigma factor [Deltaproteobacteria bacterium]|nr:sigma-70 family RNA polymerase sigma factor [Deltaproteobacteria bacterium]
MTRDEFADLALACLGEVTAFARRLTPGGADADDLIQSTYERAFATWSTLRERRACRAWLFQIARHLHVDRLRAVKARPELRLIDDDDAIPAVATMAADAIERLDAREIDAALSHLDEAQREAVLLCDVWGFAYDEIAGITGVPIGTVRSRIARGRVAIAGWLADAASADGKGRRRP